MFDTGTLPSSVTASEHAPLHATARAMRMVLQCAGSTRANGHAVRLAASWPPSRTQPSKRCARLWLCITAVLCIPDGHTRKECRQGQTDHLDSSTPAPCCAEVCTSLTIVDAWNIVNLAFLNQALYCSALAIACGQSVVRYNTVEQFLPSHTMENCVSRRGQPIGPKAVSGQRSFCRARRSPPARHGPRCD